MNRYAKEQGDRGVKHIIDLLTKFVEEKEQDFEAMDKAEQEELLQLFRAAPGDFKNLLLGNYGKLPVGWPAEWVYQSTFGEEWESKIKERKEISPLDSMPGDDLDKLRKDLQENVGRDSDRGRVHPLPHAPEGRAGVHRIPRQVRRGAACAADRCLAKRADQAGDRVDFEHWGKPYSIELVSIGAEHEGVIHVVMRVNNKTRVYTVMTPAGQEDRDQDGKGPDNIGAPINGNLWRIGNPARGPVKAGDIVHKGEEIANLEAMKMENAILAPMDGQIVEVCVRLNETVQEGQLLFVIEKSSVKAEANGTAGASLFNSAGIACIKTRQESSCRVFYFMVPALFLAIP